MKKKFLLLLFIFGLMNAGFAETFGRTDLNTVFTAPPAPVFSDAERQNELQKRRENVFAKMQDKSIMILFSADRKIYANDVEFYYRQENNLFYLTNLKQNGATLVLTKNAGENRAILFLPKRNPQAEVWNGRMYSNEEAERISGIKTIVDRSELDEFIAAFTSKTEFISTGEVKIPNGLETVYLLSPQPTRGRISLTEYPQEKEFAQTLSGYKIENAQPIFAELRLVKSPMEIKLVQHAIDITTEAIMRAMKTVDKTNWEYETQAEIEYTFRRRNADFWGFPSIVGCGANATTLHYVESQGECKKGDLILMDIGAEYEHYSADITRTFPVSGKFTKEQADIYKIVYDAQNAAAKAVKPGARFNESSNAARAHAINELVKIGLITAADATFQMDFNGQLINYPQYMLWYLHDSKHWLGMNVHDVGGGGETILKEGMIFTNEPGIYIRADALDFIPDTPANKAFLAKIRFAFEKYKNIGVRIEDDLLVTKTGVEWMTKKLPRSIKEIEDVMKNTSMEK